MISMISAAASLAQLNSMIARSDEGAGVATLRFYTSPVPDAPGGTSETPQAVVQLGNPSAKVIGGVLVWNTAGGGMVMADGIPRWCEWVARDGVQLHVGDVTDMDGGGFHRLDGAQTPPGETGPLFYAGSLIVPGFSVIT